MKENYDIIIVGAGISGLACAQKCNENSKDFLLIEKSSRIGGRVGSVKSERFIFDIGFLEGIRIFQGYRMIVFGGIVAVILIYRPRGILDEEQVHQLRHVKWKR